MDMFPSRPDGDYNVLLIGDARVLPVPATEYRDGVSWAIIDDGPLDVRDRWMPPSNAASALVTTALDEMASTSTLRAGRLLAPLSIRFVVVPEFDGVTSTVNDPLPLPTGLVEALEDQLDLVALRPGLPTLEAFENRAWFPKQAQLDAAVTFNFNYTDLGVGFNDPVEGAAEDDAPQPDQDRRDGAEHAQHTVARGQ